MSNIHPVPESFKETALIDQQDYERIYNASIDDNEQFWSNTAKRLDWKQFPTRIKDVSFDKSDLHIRWFEDGVLNACHNCVDRHLEQRGSATANFTSVSAAWQMC
jgi:acetyl-CoA synthetase